jgi:hypothetical protein
LQRRFPLDMEGIAFYAKVLLVVGLGDIIVGATLEMV